MEIGKFESPGNRLRRFRRVLNLTQVQLAQKSGLSRRGIQDLEHDINHPRADTLQRLAAALELTGEALEEFLAGFIPPSHARNGEIEQPLATSTSEAAANPAISNLGSGTLRSLAHAIPAFSAAYWPSADHIPSELVTGTAEALTELMAEFTKLMQRGQHVRAAYAIPGLIQSVRPGIYVNLLEHNKPIVIDALATSEDDPQLHQNLITAWLNAPMLMIPMWWHEDVRSAQWFNWPRYLIRAGGLNALAHSSVDPTPDFHRFDTRNTGSVENFFQWVQTLSSIWPEDHGQSSHIWLADPILPVTLLDLLQDPDILCFLPISAELKRTLDAHVAERAPGPKQLVGDLFRAGAAAMKSPMSAATSLADRYDVAVNDLETRSRLTEQLSHWAQNVDAQKRAELATALRAFDWVMGLLSYQKRGDLHVPAFTFASARPFSTLVGLLPIERTIDPLIKVLSTARDPNLIFHVLYCLGLLNYPTRNDIWILLRQTRLRMRARKEEYGPMWRALDREFLYIEGQLGSDQAIAEYLRLLKDKDGTHFEIAFNIQYYRGNTERVIRSLEDKLDDSGRPDRILRPVWDLVRRELLKLTISGLRGHDTIDPRLWPID